MSGIGTDNPASGTQAFEAGYAAARASRSAALADERARKKRRRALKPKVMPDGLNPAEQRTWRLKEQLRREEAKQFAENARFEAGLVRERLQQGFRLFAPKKVYGRWREDVRELGLRSEAFGLPGKLFVASCHKGGELRVSWDKANLSVESRSKLLSLDLPYFEGNRTFLSFWRIDLDQTWPSVDACIDDIRQLVGCKIPFAPHLVAGDERTDGSFARPHIFFLLPPGEAVWNDPDDRRCNMRTVKFFEAVYYGIVAALKELQADPGAPATTQRGKNPLSPLATGFVMNESEFMSMSEWAGWVDTSLNREALVRQRAADKAGVDLETSNEIFTAIQKEAYWILRQWYFNSDLRLRAPEATVADNLHQALEPVAQNLVVGLPGRGRMSERQVALLVSRVASYAAGSFDPARLEKGIARKALLHVVGHLPTVRERQQVAAEYASKEKAEKTLARLVDAWNFLAVESAEVSKSALAREAGVSRPTVYARWAELKALLAARKRCKVRCIDKKPVLLPAGMNFSITACQDRAPVIIVPVHDAIARASVTEDTEIQIIEDGRHEQTPHIVLPPCPVVVRVTPVVIPETIGRANDATIWQPDDDDLDSGIIAEQEAFLAADLEYMPNWDG
ncbi:hypothetical protein GGQ99_005124 [Aminobacter niigataensis]|uniref:Uncharacterized protein n=1 Tax=Aminobacter niigataensis TaxID=83265 RepID=A0ABR6L949_9HYPH|nr:hypothetical protein [Aminobacter niigataensis]MBB4653334.1 hypothetical protein [Aminobacter niigataensis]